MTLTLLPKPKNDDCLRVVVRLPAGTAREIRSRLHERQKGRPGVYRFNFSMAERAVMRRRAPMPVSQWAERHRVVAYSTIPGRWHNSITPYSAGIMDASFHEAVRKIGICKCPQSGITEAIHNCIGYAIDRSPGPVMYVYPMNSPRARTPKTASSP